MACPACGCKTTYQFNQDEFDLDDERMERCACCGEVFDVDDHTPEDEDEHYDPPPFNLSWACFTASMRLELYINQRAQFHKNQLIESGWQRRRKDLLHEIYGEDLPPFLIAFLGGWTNNQATAAEQRRRAGGYQ